MGRVEKKKMKDIYQETETQLLNKEKIKIKKQKNKDKNCSKFSNRAVLHILRLLTHANSPTALIESYFRRWSLKCCETE